MAANQNKSLLFQSIANDILTKGYSINPYALPDNLSTLLLKQLSELPKNSFERAGVGRAKDRMINDTIRTDEVCWITSSSKAGIAWIQWTTSLQLFLNQQLFLGLFSFESHFSHYAKGDFYKKHKDAFKGQGNRVLSMVVYLNKNWSSNNGGELVIYDESFPSDLSIRQGKITVQPILGTLVFFLSEDFPHEVLTTECDRYSIAGWFSLNTSIAKACHSPDMLDLN
ncbi:2OG-Fe(II) oxygenase [Colwelliaceae bacterium 6441]